MKRILIPLPDYDFDLTEVAVPWKLFRQKGYEVRFATEHGKRPFCDPFMITGVVFGKLGASEEAISYYREMEKDIHFLQPLKYEEINASFFDALILPGGHAKRMKQYLESKALQQKVIEFFKHQKVTGSICHGSIVLARTIDPQTGKSVVYNKKITGLTKFLEKLAYYITFWKMGTYYRTYPAYVQDEVEDSLSDKRNFKTGGKQFKPYVCVDGNLVSARWPKDAYLFAETVIKVLESEADMD